MTATASRPKLERTTFTTSRLLDFCSEKELVAQTGHQTDEWPLVVAKELIDNALDACEESGVAPRIKVVVNSSSITIADNGPGMPVETIDGVLDYSVRVSSREAYAAPDRGAQGNALKTLLPMPFVLDGDHGRVDISSHGQRHEIFFAVDPIRQKPVVSRSPHQAKKVKTGTRVKVFWASPLTDVRGGFLQIADDFAFLNPHATVAVSWFGERSVVKASAAAWKKWRPSDPTSPHWYDRQHFERLIAAYIAHDQDRGDDRLVRDLIREFRGLSGSAKQKAVLDATGLARTSLSSLVNCDGLRHDVVDKLLVAMKNASKPVKPVALGVIGKNHIETRFSDIGAEMETFEYRKVAAEIDGLPVVVEAAFAWCPDGDERRIITGVNWSPGIKAPFRNLGGHGGLDDLLERQKAGWDEQVVLLVHLACPRVQYTDRGKSAVVIESELGEIITKAVTAVTAKWAKQRRAEEREASRIANRRDALIRRRQMSIKDAAWKVMEEAYLKASTGGKYPAKTRQIYYAARGKILGMTGKDKLRQQYFSQTLVPAYVEEHPDETANWDVVYDARGKLTEPHTGKTVPLGTVEVRRYLERVRSHSVPDGVPIDLPVTYPTCGPNRRFGAIMFIEKEGFDDLFHAVNLAGRYDIAVMSTKGMSVTACRELADVLCGEHGIPLLVLHDFDKSGFSILGTLQRDTQRYEFRNDFPVIDLGLRLADVEAYSLESEPVCYGANRHGDPRDPRPNLRKNGATGEEVTFLCSDRRHGSGWHGRRVELNAFTSGDLIQWLEIKLVEHGIQKVVPDDAVLESAYRRAMEIAVVRRQLSEIADAAHERAQETAVPKSLRATIEKRLAAEPTRAWDEVLAELAGEAEEE